jgi:RNA polymerase sigma-70 factor, ECF subfamily
MRAAELDALLDEIACTSSPRAFSAVYAHYKPLLVRFFASRRAVDADPEDLTQQVLQIVWQKAHLFSSQKASATTWIYAVARNRHIDALRRLRRARNDVFELEGASNDLFDPSLRIDSDTVFANLAVLPPPQAAVVHAFYFLDKTHAQVATELSMPLGTVKSCLRLALVKIRRAYKLADA